MAETEAFLLRRFAKTGDAEAFAEIIRRHAGLVYGAALRILADVDRASDVAQDTFLQLTKDAHCVTGSLPGWLHRVATHKAIDQVRRERSRRHREVAYAAGQPQKTADWKEISPYVDEELNRLDPEIRDILIAHFLQGQTTRHIAVFRGISQATVSRRIEAGVATLRGMLRRRGILVAAGALTALLGENAVTAAPMALMTELGKMALVGGHAAAASAVGTTTGSGAQTLAAGVLAGVKGKAVAVAAVAVIGAGSVVTYHNATEPSDSDIVIRRSATPRAPRPVSSPAAPAPVSQPRMAGPSQASREWDQLISGAVNQVRSPTGDASPPPESAPPPQATAAGEEPPPAGEGVDGGLAGALVPPPAGPAELPPEIPEGQPIAGMGMGGGAFYGARYASPPPNEPNDSNDRDDEP
ncbi:MAG: sigma-70 family RNA polymerase sigma factor [Sedimentisphaerales bacterium]|nr:sigma-70 family RNA polymerase sigma factor [Sedimentisphaerales bacterium]